jgi:hypothetical protein
MIDTCSSVQNVGIMRPNNAIELQFSNFGTGDPASISKNYHSSSYSRDPFQSRRTCKSR